MPTTPVDPPTEGMAKIPEVKVRSLHDSVTSIAPTETGGRSNMQSGRRLEQTRSFVVHYFQRHEPQANLPLRETLLICDGCYCGHRFSRGQMSAVWFLEEDEIKFYGSDGTVMEVVRSVRAGDRPHAA
jgi:hypothetical protein